VRNIFQLGGHQRLVEAKHGYFLYNLHDHYIGRALELYGEYAEQEMQLFSSLLLPDDQVIEIGANIGTHTIPLAKAVPSGLVHAFEPQPVVFQNLCANLSLNCCENVLAWPAAVGREKGKLVVPPVDYCSPGNFGGISLKEEGDGVEIEVLRLDDYAVKLTSLKLLKIDVEGMEKNVIDGGRNTIQRLRPIMYVENDRIELSKALIETVVELNYRLYWHIPKLFNPDNCFENDENIYGNIAAFNMFCVPVELEIEVKDAVEILDSDAHPLKNLISG
jgi:FkbM family methyltransferase